jgi:lipopolysaccharide biosynthesis protein
VSPSGALAPDVAILCHYAAGGGIRADTIRYLRAVRDAGFSIVVVSNGGASAGEAVLTDIGAILLRRPNIGRDFSAWRMAMRRLRLPRADTRRILLINDSVYGPLAPLAPLLARMTPERADLWGLTDSFERGWHLQSYFLLAQHRLIHSAVWRMFWRGVVPLPSKRWTVGRYEIGLSRRALAAGFRAAAVFPYASVVPDGSVANPTLGAWRALLDAGFPFLKRALLRDNPNGVPEAWRSLVPPNCVAEIDADLRGAPRA